MDDGNGIAWQWNVRRAAQLKEITPASRSDRFQFANRLHIRRWHPVPNLLHLPYNRLWTGKRSSIHCSADARMFGNRQGVSSPTSDRYINFTVPASELQIHVTDITGKIVEQQISASGRQSTFLSLQSLPAGVYLLSMNDGSTAITPVPDCETIVFWGLWFIGL